MRRETKTKSRLSPWKKVRSLKTALARFTPDQEQAAATELKHRSESFANTKLELSYPLPSISLFALSLHRAASTSVATPLIWHKNGLQSLGGIYFLISGSNWPAGKEEGAVVTQKLFNRWPIKNCIELKYLLIHVEILMDG